MSDQTAWRRASPRPRNGWPASSTSSAWPGWSP